jgi:hypothetical protein
MIAMSVSGVSPIDDVNAMLPGISIYRDSDKITHVHESTHGINSQLRNRFGRPTFYVMGGVWFHVDEPKTTLSAVARSIPTEKRGDVYKLYCVDAQRWWNNEPSYLIDEMVAYINGAETRKFYGITNRAETLRYARELATYVKYLPIDDWSWYDIQMKRLENIEKAIDTK